MAGLPVGEVTLLFTDIEGSTALLHDLGDAYGELLAEHDRVLRAVWAAHGGVVVDTAGDSFFVAFGSARAAVAAVVEAQAQLTSVKVRMGLHTGTPRLRGENYWGQDVHYAARVGAAAHGGQVLLSAATRVLVPEAAAEDLGEHALKDFPAPRRLFHLDVGRGGASAFRPVNTLSVARTNLPSTYGPLIGRAAELAAIEDALTGACRLLTLTGVGGSGKSRLAIAAGGALLDRFPDGVYLVPLAAVASAEAVPGAIAQALRVDETALADHLATRRLLLVVDNLEHLQGAAPALMALLDGARGLRMLATSQAPLRVAAERVMPLAPLPVEPAMALFADRARAADAGFHLAPAEMETVAEICRRLDGLPLGIELAAARVRLGGPARVLAALDRGLDALGTGGADLPARQRGLRAALDWTVELLSDEQRRLFATLGVFARAWSLELLEAVAGDEHDVWEGTAALLDLSLIRARGDGRFMMAEAVQRYAQDRLAGGGRAEAVRRRHAEALAAEAVALVDAVLYDTTGTTATALDLSPDLDAAIAWAREHDRGLWRRLVSRAGALHYFTGRLRTVAADVIAATAEGDDDPLVQAHLHNAATLCAGPASPADAMAHAGRALDLARTLDDRSFSYFAFLHAIPLAFADPQAGLAVLAEAAARPGVRSDERTRRLLDGAQAASLCGAGRLDEAEALIERVLAAHDSGNFGAQFAQSCAADCALLRERYRLALARYQEVLRPLREAQSEHAVLQVVGVACALLGLDADREALVLMAGAVAARDREAGPPLGEDSLPGQAGRFAAARERLGDAEVAQAEAEGRRLEREALIDRALAVSGAVRPAA